MDKNRIKLVLRETLDELFGSVDERKKRDTKKSKDDERGAKDKKEPGEGGKKDYSDVKRAFQKLGGPSMVDAMILTGIKDDEKGTNRSLFRKKVKQIKNKDTGSYYQFSDKELNKVRAALDIAK